MPFISQKDLNKIGAVAFGLGVLDFFLEGKLQAPISRALKKAGKAAAAKAFLNPGQVPTNMALARGIGGAVGRAAVRPAGTALAVGRTIALRHPILTAGAVVYYTYKNRDELADLVRQGYDVVSDLPLFEPGVPRQTFEEVYERRAPENVVLDVLTGRKRPKKRKSSYNSAVSKAMKAVKRSTSYGVKGALNNPKKAFGFVARTVSKLRRGKKVSSKGASGVVKRALPGISKIEVRK
jgi:hypothetical protein